MNKKDAIEKLRQQIQETHKCSAAHRRTVQVNEVLQAQTVWKGEVEVFWLTGHAQAKRCYAWIQKDNGQKCVMVLEIAPVIGPATAVRAALAGQATKSMTPAER